MPVTDADFNDLKTRVTRLERASVNNTETITWMASTLGTIKAGVDMHTKRLDSIDSRLDGIDVRLDGIDVRLDGIDVHLDGIDDRLDRIESDLKGLRDDMPGIVAAAMREVMRKS